MKRTAQLLLMLVWLGTMAAEAQIPSQIQYPNPFKHIILMVQENRTPDNLFHGLLNWAGANPAKYDIATSGINSKGHKIPLAPVPLGNVYDLDHSHAAFEAMYDKGKMDGGNKIGCSPTSGPCPAYPQFKYVENQNHILDPYLTLATQYGWANFMFQTNQGPSYPAHQFLFGGTSAFSKGGDADGVFVSGNPDAKKGPSYAAGHTGCLAPLSEWNWLIHPDGSQTQLNNDPLGTLCFSHDTMASLLDFAGITWRYYSLRANGGLSDPGGSIFTAPNSIRDICDPNSDYTKCTGAEWADNVDLTPSDVLRDIRACKLKEVSWVIPTGQNSDHPGSPSNIGGPSWVASVVNAIGNDTNCEHGHGYWSDTAIVITWDDWGGWYDHEAPTILPGSQGGYQYGFRVPLLAVSAYTPSAYVDNERHDFGSILRFIEGVFGIKEGSLGFADARSKTDLHGFFNFRQKPRKFQTIEAPLDADFFINDTTLPLPPDND
jgi:phospholipase C